MTGHLPRLSPSLAVVYHCRQRAAANRAEGAATGPASLQTAGRRGDGVSHSHALDQRSGFMGGARRGLNGALCVTAGTSSNPRLRRVTPEKRKKRRRRRRGSPPGANTCVSALSYLHLLLFLFFSYPFPYYFTTSLLLCVLSIRHFRSDLGP